MCSTRQALGGPEGLAAFTGAVEAFRARPTEGRPADAVTAELMQLRYLIDALELEFAKTAAAFAETEEYEAWAHVSPIAWLRHECRMSSTAAARAIRVGDQAARLTDSIDRLQQGAIGYTHLSLIADTAEYVTRTDDANAFDEAALLNLAQEHTIGRFRRDCDHARHAADQQRFLHDHLAQRRERFLEMTRGGEGDIWIRGRLDGVAGATVMAALEPLAKLSGKGDDRIHERRMADALVELAFRSMNEGIVSQHASQRPHVQVTTSMDTLMGLPGSPAGEMQRGTTIPAHVVQRFACDGAITRVVVGSDSAILDVGRTQRVASGSLRTALNHRDRGCTWPGCDRPETWCEAHHLQHWSHHGQTDLANMVLLCHRHHEMVHEVGWKLLREADASWLVLPPNVFPERPRAPAAAVGW